MADYRPVTNALYGADIGDPSYYRTQLANALMGPVVTPESRDGRTPQSYGALNSLQARPQDWHDRNSITEMVAGAVNPAAIGYGAGEMAGHARNALYDGNYGQAGGLGLLSAMSVMPAVKRKLPMDAASRMARAQEMGFDTRKVWHHGTPNGMLETIEPGRRDPGAWFTTDISNANNYARGENAYIHSTHLKTKNPFVVEHGGDGDFLPTHKGQPLGLTNNVDIVKHAQRMGYDSVHFPDGNFTESGNTMVVFNPTQVRETSAAFDPNKADSRNLLASGAGLGLFGYGSYKNEK